MPHINLTSYDLQILTKAIDLFSEAMAHNRKPIPTLPLAAISLRKLQEKVQGLRSHELAVADFDFNETLIIITALNLYQVDISFRTLNDASLRKLKSCQDMMEYFKATQEQGQKDNRRNLN